MWEWDVSKQTGCSDDGGNESSYESILEEDASEEKLDSDNEEQTKIPYVMHTVVLNCIGCVRSQEYQDTLRAARDLIAQGRFVLVRLTPELTT